MSLKDLKLDYRTNKDIVESIVLHSDHFTMSYKAKRIFINNKMFLGISNNDGKTCYELKVTTKKERIVEPKEKQNTDEEKGIYLSHLRTVLKMIFNVIDYDNGLLIQDYNKDYFITLVKKKAYKW